MRYSQLFTVSKPIVEICRLAYDQEICSIWEWHLKNGTHFVQASMYPVNTLRLRQNDHPFADDTFKRIFLDENVRISLKFVLRGPIDNIPALVQIMAWRRSSNKPLSEPMMVNSLTHICITQSQWVNVTYEKKDKKWHEHAFNMFAKSKTTKHIEVETKLLPFCRWCFQIIFFHENC